MAKKKDTEVDDIFQKLAEATGGEVLGSMESAKYFIDTGCLAINYVSSGRFIGGGIPGGRLSEFFGPSASSKSLIATNILFGCQKLGGFAVLLDAENSVNKEFVKSASHCDLGKILRFTPQTLEQSFVKIYKVVEMIRKNPKYKKTPIVIVYDSITVSPCERELREINLPENYTEAQYKAIVKRHEQPGERAKICSAEFRKLNSFMEENDVTVVVLNQVRSKIGVMFGNPETTGGGGKALEFYASLRMRPQTQKTIQRKIIGKKKRTIGINIKMVNKKNRSYRPFAEADNIPLYFEKGINPLGGLLGALLDADRITIEGKGMFKVRDAYSNGEDVTFKSSIDRNDVPEDVLEKCPALIDAADAQEVKDYLAPFREAIEYTQEASISEDHEEINVGEDDEDEVDEAIDEELES